VQPACWRIQAEKLAPFLMEIDTAGNSAGAVAALRRVGTGTASGGARPGSASARLR